MGDKVEDTGGTTGVCVSTAVGDSSDGAPLGWSDGIAVSATGDTTGDAVSMDPLDGALDGASDGKVVEDGAASGEVVPLDFGEETGGASGEVVPLDFGEEIGTSLPDDFGA